MSRQISPNGCCTVHHFKTTRCPQCGAQILVRCGKCKSIIRKVDHKCFNAPTRKPKE